MYQGKKRKKNSLRTLLDENWQVKLQVNFSRTILLDSFSMIIV